MNSIPCSIKELKIAIIVVKGLKITMTTLNKENHNVPKLFLPTISSNAFPKLQSDKNYSMQDHLVLYAVESYKTKKKGKV